MEYLQNRCLTGLMDIMFRALKTEFTHLERVSALTDYITTNFGNLILWPRTKESNLSECYTFFNCKKLNLETQ